MLAAKDKPGLLFGITFYKRPVQPEWAMSIVSLVGSLPINTSYGFSLSKDHPIAEARNAIAEQAIKNHVKYLFFIDDDTAPPNFAVSRLMSILEGDSKVGVAGGIYFTKTNPPQPVVGRKFGQGPSWDWKLGDVFECETLGTGCMMIRTAIFEHLEKPWFKEVSELHPSEGIESLKMTDDVYFLHKVKEAGYKIMADGGTIPLHWDVNTGEHYTIPVDSPPVRAYEEAQKQERKKVSFTPEPVAI